MARQFTVTPTKTYATESNAVKAVEKMYGDINDLRYYIVWNQAGRCYPIFVGQRALDQQVFHAGFCVVM